jgi:hypothetical protein
MYNRLGVLSQAVFMRLSHPWHPDNFAPRSYHGPLVPNPAWQLEIDHKIGYFQGARIHPEWLNPVSWSTSAYVERKLQVFKISPSLEWIVICNSFPVSDLIICDKLGR